MSKNIMIKEKTGIDIKEVIDIIKKGIDNGSEENKNKHLYDFFLILNRLWTNLLKYCVICQKNTL